MARMSFKELEVLVETYCQKASACYSQITRASIRHLLFLPHTGPKGTRCEEMVYVVGTLERNQTHSPPAKEGKMEAWEYHHVKICVRMACRKAMSDLKLKKN